MMTTTMRALSPIGAEIVGADVEHLLHDPSVPEFLTTTLETHGVVVIRELHLDDAAQVALARRLGTPVVKATPGYHAEFPEIFHVSLDRRINNAAYMKATFGWHIDGCTGSVACPPKASLLTARRLAPGGGQTQFASTYAAYRSLSDEERARVDGLRVCHALEASYTRIDPDPSTEVLAQLRADQNRVHPLVWTHPDGRKSLVIGTHAWFVEGMDRAGGRTLLRDLERRATAEAAVYTHDWTVGDLVIWDNRGVLHRAVPYADDSGREMHRVTLVGEEPIQ